MIYLRDDKPEIPFPNHWDLFGGHLEAGETPEQALVREVKEELGIELESLALRFGALTAQSGMPIPTSNIFTGPTIDKSPAELTLYEGQRLRSIAMAERKEIKFANILGALSMISLAPVCGRQAVDNF